MMDVGTVLAPAYDPLMRLCGWTRAQRSVLSASRGSVLDVGCGPARLADAVPGTYVGVDLRLAMLTRAHGPHLVCADAAALPFPNRMFDTVVSTAFLGLLSPDRRHPILCEMARVCTHRIRILEPVSPLSTARRALTLSRQPIDIDELCDAGWHVRSVGPRVYAGAYTLVTAEPQAQSR